MCVAVSAVLVQMPVIASAGVLQPRRALMASQGLAVFTIGRCVEMRLKLQPESLVGFTKLR